MQLIELQEFENDTAEARLKYTEFCVEANSFEQHELWARHSCRGIIDYIYNCGRKGEPVYKKHWVNWKHINNGWIVTVGYDNKRPICISVSWARIEGKLVMFWYPTSKIVNYDKIQEWISEHFNKTYDNGRSCMIDVQSFTHCLDFLRRSKVN